MSHTPGPWESKDWQVAAWPNGRLDIICHTALNKSQRTEENKANARLIAAAPDLLAACKAAFNFIDDVAIQKQVADAIEKAEGE